MDNNKVIKIYNKRTKVFVGYLTLLDYQYCKVIHSKPNPSQYGYSSSVAIYESVFAITQKLEDILLPEFNDNLNKKEIYRGLKHHYKDTLEKVMNIKSENDLFIKNVTIIQEQRRLKIKQCGGK